MVNPSASANIDLYLLYRLKFSRPLGERVPRQHTVDPAEITVLFQNGWGDAERLLILLYEYPFSKSTKDIRDLPQKTELEKQSRNSRTTAGCWKAS